jgi:hypothetical protein|tara:strand:+ start:885 stop:1001 length:117 start_codon:yes stop_codon:yes gene_type:complete
MQPIGTAVGQQRRKVKEVNHTSFKTGIKKEARADKKGR